MRTVACIVTLMAAAGPALAQQPAPGSERALGQVVAVVGDSAIFNFSIEEGVNARVAERRLQAPPPPGPELEQWKKEVLEERINELLILQAALRDTTLRVAEDQLTRSVQQDIEQRQQQAGGPAAFERILRASGLTPATYRDMLTEQQRRAALIQQYVQRARQRRKAPPVSEQELRAYFETMRERLPPRPPTVSFQQVVVLTAPTEAALARARQVADSAFELVRTKEEDFAELARRLNTDATREKGGDLGWFRRGMMIPDFENVAFMMQPGAVSPPVRTQYGYHLIKVERVKGPEIQARHILIAPERTTDDALRARTRADTVAQRLREGGDAVELARQYGDKDEPVRVPPVEIGKIQEEYGIDLSNATVGEVIGPVPVGGAEVASKFVVLKILQREASRPRTLEDPEVRERLRQDLEFQKLFAEIIADLRRSTYVEVRTG
jgi:peptidyl-prolyl cis-trans isomerase SurA